MTKRLRWALALSLGLNLFLLAQQSARWLHRPSIDRVPAHEDHGERRGRGLGRLFGPPTPELREQHKALGAARGRVASALQAEHYDPEQLERALQELRVTTARGQELLHQKLLDKAGQLSPEERKARQQPLFARGPPGGAWTTLTVEINRTSGPA